MELKDKLRKTKTRLQTLSRTPFIGTTLPPSLIDSIKKLTSSVAYIESAEHAFECREKAWASIKNHENESDPMMRLSNILRTNLVQSYFASKWSIADSLMVFFKSNIFHHGKADISLTPLFFPKQPNQSRTDFSFSLWLRENYGFPVTLSYYLRNNFLHHSGQNFWGVPTHDDVFVMKNVRALYGKAEILDQNFHRHSEWPKYESFIDLATALEKEYDECLCILLDWTMTGLETRTKLFMLRDQ